MKISKRYYYLGTSLLIFGTVLNIYFSSCGNKNEKPNNLLSASELVNNPIEEGGKFSSDTSLLPKIHFFIFI
jgi:hypothetical protein